MQFTLPLDFTLCPSSSGSSSGSGNVDADTQWLRGRAVVAPWDAIENYVCEEDPDFMAGSFSIGPLPSGQYLQVSFVFDATGDTWISFSLPCGSVQYHLVGGYFDLCGAGGTFQSGTSTMVVSRQD